MFCSMQDFISKTLSLKDAVTDMRYFARNNLSSSLAHEKNFSLIWQINFKLGCAFCQER